MLGKTVMPKSKAELIRAMQNAWFRSFDVFEGGQLSRVPSLTDLTRLNASMIVLNPLL